MPKIYKDIYKFLKPVGISALILFVLTAINYKSLPSGEKHYQGVSNITTEQFLSVKGDKSVYNAINDAPLGINTYVPNPDGTVKYSYNFISSQSFDFLKSSGVKWYNLWPVSSFLPNAFNNSYFGMLFIMLLVFIMLNWYRSKNPQGYNEKTTKVRHWIEGLSDSNIKPPVNYNITTKVSDVIVRDYKGIIAVRVWKIQKGKLKSVVQDTVWDNNMLNADRKKLKENGEEGIYAYRIGSLMRYSGIVMGIVEMQGQYYYHSDIVRAENCVIKCLFVSKGRMNLAKTLSNQYGVKVLLGDRKEQAYTDWLFSQNGLECWEHNYKLLEGEDDGSRKESQEERIHTISETSTNP